MKCKIHYGRDASGVCQTCNAWLCPDCIALLGNTCSDCLEKDIRATLLNDAKTILMCFVFLALGLKFFKGMIISNNIIETIFVAFMFMMLPFGWKALSKITSSMFLFLPIVGWLVYFIVKFFLALMCGWIFAIPKVIEIVKDIRNCITLMKRIKEQKE